jgi:D-alanyl-lipoteichoic acid acyltransferase DltB (MBOAT superfamily)
MYPTAAPYFLFLAAICLVYWAGCRVRVLRLAVLLAASLFFLAKFGLGGLLLVPAAATLDFLFGWGIKLSPRKLGQRLFLGGSLLLNVGLLVAAKGFGTHLGWLFTLSLSYYCFQQLSYTIDIYRGDGEPARSYLTYLAAAIFFPVITAGPINRLTDLVGKLERPFDLEEPKNARALLLIATGLVKKLLIAQFLADNLVNSFLDTPKLYSGLEVLIAVLGYAFQLYYDFSGYTDIAMGSALLLGVSVPENFRRPYSSANIAEFWRRWHISFSSWLRDYVYFSLPSERRWNAAKFVNPVVTMLLGGLWHGFGWTFLIWGAMHGSMLAVTRGWQDWRKKTKKKAVTVRGLAVGRWVAVFFTFQFVCAAWVFFRADSVGDAAGVFARIGSGTWSVEHISWQIAAYLVAAVGLHALPEAWFERTVGMFSRVPFVVQGAALAGVVLALEALAGKGAAPFAYSRF